MNGIRHTLRKARLLMLLLSLTACMSISPWKNQSSHSKSRSSKTELAKKKTRKSKKLSKKITKKLKQRKLRSSKRRTKISKRKRLNRKQPDFSLGDGDPKIIKETKDRKWYSRSFE